MEFKFLAIGMCRFQTSGRKQDWDLAKQPHRYLIRNPQQAAKIPAGLLRWLLGADFKRKKCKVEASCLGVRLRFPLCTCQHTCGPRPLRKKRTECLTCQRLVSASPTATSFWVAVKEPNSNYHSRETCIYICSKSYGFWIIETYLKFL